MSVIGNIPYNITSPILFKLIENHTLVHDAVFMVQHEVAKRMTAEMGTKDYGILSLILEFFTETKYCFKVSRNVFYPKPNVDSAIVHLFFKNFEYTVDPRLFIKVVKAAFGNRRKTLKNSIRNSIFNHIDFSGCTLDFSKRAEEFNLDDFIYFTQFISGRLVNHE